MIMTDFRAETQASWVVTAEKIEEAVRRIVEAARPVRVVLFGSHARGEARPDSDVDLLVVEENVKDAPGEATRLYQCVRDSLMAVDIVVVDRKRFDYWKDTPGNVYYEAAQDGRSLYEAA